MADGLVSVIDLRKRWKKSRSGENLIGFSEISLDPVKISPDSMIFCQIWLKSHQIYVKYCRNLGVFAKIRKLSPKSRLFARIWVFVNWFRFFRFWGREIETDLPELVYGGEDLSPNVGVVGSTSVGSNPVSFFGWIESSDESGPPYS